MSLSVRDALYGTWIPLDARGNGAALTDAGVIMILRAIKEAGFTVVPVEPTFAMELAVAGPIKGAVETYKAMISAAQETAQ